MSFVRMLKFWDISFSLNAKLPDIGLEASISTNKAIAEVLFYRLLYCQAFWPYFADGTLSRPITILGRHLLLMTTDVTLLSTQWTVSDQKKWIAIICTRLRQMNIYFAFKSYFTNTIDLSLFNTTFRNYRQQRCESCSVKVQTVVKQLFCLCYPDVCYIAHCLNQWFSTWSGWTWTRIHKNNSYFSKM